MNWSVIPENLPFLLGGLAVTFKLALLSLAGGSVLGIFVALARLSSRAWVYWPATVYVNVLRSNPLIVVIFWFYFILPIIIGTPLGDFRSAVVAFICFESAYFAEIVRAGIQSIRKQQIQAGYSTGLTYFQTMRFIVLPPALKNMIPILVTQCIILFQDTSMAYVIGVREFLRVTALVDARIFRSFELYVFAGAVYFVICYAGSLVTRRLEVKK